MNACIIWFLIRDDAIQKRETFDSIKEDSDN